MYIVGQDWFLATIVFQSESYTNLVKIIGILGKK